MKRGRERFSTRRKLVKKKTKNCYKLKVCCQLKDLILTCSGCRTGTFKTTTEITCKHLQLTTPVQFCSRNTSVRSKAKVTKHLQQLTHHPHNRGTASAGYRCLWSAALPSAGGSRPSPPDPGRIQNRPKCSACHWMGQQLDRDPKTLRKR